MANYKSAQPIRNADDPLEVPFKVLSHGSDDGGATERILLTDNQGRLEVGPGTSMIGLIKITDGTNPVTVTQVGSDYGLDVNVISSIDFDDLVHTDDSVLIYGWDGVSNQKIAVNNLGELKLDDTTLSTLATEATLLLVEETANAIQTSVEIMDDWDENNRAKVNVNWNAGQSVSLNQGIMDAGTLRVTLATDDEVNNNIEAIKTALEIMDDWDDGDKAKVHLYDITNIAGQAVMNNSVPVTIASDQSVIDVNVVSEVASNRVHDAQRYNELAKDTTHKFTYTNGNNVFYLEQVFGSGTGRMAMEVLVGPLGSTVQKSMSFTSASNLNTDIHFDQPIKVDPSGVVEIIIENRDKDDFDVFEFVNGYEL